MEIEVAKTCKTCGRGLTFEGLSWADIFIRRHKSGGHECIQVYTECACGSTYGIRGCHVSREDTLLSDQQMAMILGKWKFPRGAKINEWQRAPYESVHAAFHVA